MKSPMIIDRSVSEPVGAPRLEDEGGAGGLVVILYDGWYTVLDLGEILRLRAPTSKGEDTRRL